MIPRVLKKMIPHPKDSHTIEENIFGGIRKRLGEINQYDFHFLINVNTTSLSHLQAEHFQIHFEHFRMLIILCNGHIS